MQVAAVQPVIEDGKQMIQGAGVGQVKVRRQAELEIVCVLGRGDCVGAEVAAVSAEEFAIDQVGLLGGRVLLVCLTSSNGDVDIDEARWDRTGLEN